LRVQLLTVLMALVSVGATGAAPDPHTEPPVPPLPAGPLQLFAGNQYGANFIVLDEVKQTGSSVTAWIFAVPSKPYSLGEAKTPENIVTQTMTQVRFDCAKRDVFVMLNNSAFNTYGKRLVWLPQEAPKPIAPRSTQYYLVQVVCDHHPLPPSNNVIGHDLAITAAHLAFKYNGW